MPANRVVIVTGTVLLGLMALLAHSLSSPTDSPRSEQQAKISQHKPVPSQADHSRNSSPPPKP
jgi:hypothetical protein